MSDKKVYMIDTINAFNVRYAIEVDASLTASEIRDKLNSIINDGELFEFSQNHICERITSMHEINSDEQYIELFDADNIHSKHFTDECKKAFINQLEI